MKKTILIFCFFSTFLFANVKENIKFEHYYINPKKSSEVERELFSKTPISYKGKKFLGQTKWDVDYSLGLTYYAEYCKTNSKPKVTLNVTYTMPQVKNSVPGSIKHKFKRFYNKLLKHEKNHKKNGLKAAKEIDRELRVFRKEKTCDILEAKVNKKIKKIIKKYNRLDELYDKRTQHGKSEGVVVSNYF